MGWDSSLDPTTAPAGMLMAAWKDMTKEQRSEEMKRRRAVAKANGKTGRKKSTRKGGKRDNGSEKTHEEDHSQSISFLAGIISEKISNYAASSGIPRPTLAAGVAAILRHQEGG